MARSMFDSTQPNDAPKSPIDGNSGGILVAYYPYAFSSPAKSEFPAGTIFVTIDQSTDAGHPDCDVLDVEPGCASPDQVPGWPQEHKSRTGKQGTVYCNTSTIDSIPKSEPFYWWAAEWTDNAHTQPAGSVACQYKSTGAYDASSVFDESWPPGTGPAPAPSGLYAVRKLPPGHWKNQVTLSGIVHGNRWYTSTLDGVHWTVPAKIESKLPGIGNEFFVRVLPPGEWAGTIVLGGNGTDNNRWHTSSSNGTSWAGPFKS